MPLGSGNIVPIVPTVPAGLRCPLWSGAPAGRSWRLVVPATVRTVPGPSRPAWLYSGDRDGWDGWDDLTGTQEHDCEGGR